MNSFEAELRELIEKHREYPGADLVEMARALIDAGAELRVIAAGPFAEERKFTGL